MKNKGKLLDLLRNWMITIHERIVFIKDPWYALKISLKINLKISKLKFKILNKNFYSIVI